MTTTITTTAELDALPSGAVVLDRDGDPWKKLGCGGWTIGRLVEADAETGQ